MLRSFEQKRRNKPITITDVAISKVPMIQFQGFSEEENVFIQQQHMRLLRKAKDDNKSCEVGIQFINLQSEMICKVLSRLRKLIEE